MKQTLIRQYRKKDRGFIRDIAWDTAFAGESASVFFADKEILCDFLTIYFTDYEPESCFVALVDGEVVGYLLGVKDTATMKRISKAKITPSLLFKFLFNGAIFRKKNMFFVFQCLLSLLKSEFREPDLSKLYPSCLHINLKEGFRNSGIGTKLIAAYLDYLGNEEIKGVHLATMSEKASIFFKKQGFDLLYKGHRSYFRYILHRDIPIYVFGKRLGQTG